MRFEFKFSETYLLSHQLGLILVRNAMSFDLLKFRLLNLQEFLSFAIDLIPGLLAFFKIIKSFLFAHVSIFGHLRLESGLVNFERLGFLLVHPLLIFLFSLLLLNSFQEFSTFSLSLLSESSVIITELLLTSFLHLYFNFFFLYEGLSLSFSGKPLILFKGALSAKFINFGLPVSGLFLKFAESLNLTLFFFTFAKVLCNFLFFSPDPLFIVLDYVLLTFSFTLLCLFFHLKSLLVSNVDFIHHNFDSCFLLFNDLLIFFLHFLNSPLHLSLLLLEGLFFLLAGDFSLLNLINNYKLTLLDSDFASLLSFILLL